MSELKAVLGMRRIPYWDCIEKHEVIMRVRVTHSGSCAALPVSVLKAMLSECGIAYDGVLEKEVLARKVMAVRAIQKAQRLAQHQGGSPRHDTSWHRHASVGGMVQYRGVQREESPPDPDEDGQSRTRCHCLLS